MTERQKDGKTDRLRDRKTEIQKDRKTCIEQFYFFSFHLFFNGL